LCFVSAFFHFEIFRILFLAETDLKENEKKIFLFCFLKFNWLKEGCKRKKVRIKKQLSQNKSSNEAIIMFELLLNIFL